ncbi:MAG: hypothetical protein ABMA15_14460 [Vicinamibacterales bacterium]
MSTTVKGIYKNGRIVLFETPAGIEEAEVEVTFSATSATADLAEREARRKALVQRLRDTGFNLGGAPYPTRDELHDRGR